MDSICQVKEALSARSESTSLDELKSKGRKKVRVIRAEHIASMIQEAVQRAVSESGLVSPEDAEHLVEKSREEFKALTVERQREHAELADLRQQLETAQARVSELEGMAGEGTAMAGGESPSMDMMMRLMSEMANIKANMGQGGGGGEGAEQGLMGALDKLTASMNDRMDKFGKKLGVSSAVDVGEANLDGLFKHVDEVELESNMDDVKVKSKQGGGIAGNLARLKKLKGGG
ncbi:MAG: hypothetical protein ACYTG5_11735 [Planctomycetota bacterium]|jgi:hypothetical protein